MENTQSGNLNLISHERDGMTEYFICGQSMNPEEALLSFNELFRFLQDTGASAINVRIYAVDSMIYHITQSYMENLNALTCPVTWISQPDKETVYPLSFQAHVISGADVQPIMVDDDKLGCHFSDKYADYALLKILPKSKSASQYEQAACAFDQMQDALQQVDLDFSNTLRTWLFADDILAWYDKLNQARDHFFTQHDIFNKLVPASTGIGVANPSGCALVTELFAAKAKSEKVTTERVISPLQCEALDYKSSFSRATKLTAPDHSRMYVSGTASIAQTGETIFLDDTARQIEMTLKVVDALIKNGGMNWDNTARAMVYLKDSKDFSLFDTCCKQFGINIPHVKIEADVCRDNLLFEIEMTLLQTH